jgi:CheY-like chemotaxis protein
MLNSKVLVVEDDDLIRFNIAEALSDAGFDVLEAANVVEAVGLLGMHGDIRAVFTDIDMPGCLNGLQLAALVHDRWPPIHILVASGRALASTSDIPENGRFFPKPYSSTQVIANLNELFQAA